MQYSSWIVNTLGITFLIKRGDFEPHKEVWRGACGDYIIGDIADFLEDEDLEDYTYAGIVAEYLNLGV